MIEGGIHTIPSGDYHGDPCEQPSLSASLAHILCSTSPAHARAAHPRLNPELVRVEEEKFDVGTCAHALMLEGRDTVEVIDADDWRTKAAKEQRDIARAAGRTPLLAKDWSRVQTMAAAVREQLDAFNVSPALFADGKPEQTIVWEDDYGVICRSRVDWLHDDFASIDDLKTTARSANPDGWTRQTMFSIGADVQAAFYARGVEKLTGVRPDFRFVICETSAPYAVAVVSPGPAVMALAEKKVAYALEVWAKCLRNDAWPAYPLQVCHAELPPWEESRWLERELREVAA